MKKLLFMLFALLLCAFCLTACKEESNEASEDEKVVYSEGLEFISNGDGTCSVSGIGSCTDTDVKIPPVSPDGDKVTAISENAFDSCSTIIGITIPDSVTTIGASALLGCSALENITVDENNSSYKSIRGNLYTKDGTILIKYAPGKSNTQFGVPDGVTTIGDYALACCSKLISISMPDSVTSIGFSAFRNCTRLPSIRIPDSVTTIGESAFYNCTSLKSAIIGNSVTTICSGTFAFCENLLSITISDSVTSIGDYAFFPGFSLTHVYYTGSKEDWKKIDIGKTNTELLYIVTITYNYSK